MNRRKFFAGLALVPALPVAAATAATRNAVDVSRLSALDVVPPPGSWQRATDHMQAESARLVRLIDKGNAELEAAIRSARITPDTARALRA